MVVPVAAEEVILLVTTIGRCNGRLALLIYVLTYSLNLYPQI